MSYCVNCGVELDPSAKTCPLCGTPAWHPELDAPPYFPANSAAVQPASRREAAILLTAMLVSVSLCCGLLNLFLPTDRPWSLYVIGAAVMLWVWFTLPMVLRRLPVFFRLTADVAAIGIYVWLISIDLGGSRWFRGLALPMIGWAGVLVFLLSFLLRGGRRSTLSAIALVIGAAGLLAVGIEFCIDRYFRGVWQPGWSLIVLAVCVGLIIPLRIVRILAVGFIVQMLNQIAARPSLFGIHPKQKHTILPDIQPVGVPASGKNTVIHYEPRCIRCPRGKRRP